MRISRNLPVPPPQPTSPSAEVRALRTSWKWAYLSHFLFTYNPVLHLEDIQLSELEDDLARGTFEVVPTVMQRLLTSLTPHDKRMILENWQQQLRKQSLKRDPDHNLMGTEDEPIKFSSLIMSDKLHVFQSLCEWQFHNPNNLRARMKDDDDYANWRIEPVAYDAKGNAYWLMGGNRLWIQYAPPPKRTTKSHKRKEPAAMTNERKSTKRRLIGTIASSKSCAGSATNSKSKPVALTSIGRPMRETRSRGTPVGSPSPQKPRTIGTRVSTRLRGREEDVWQAIPEEWLRGDSNEDNAEILHKDRQSKGEWTGQAVEPKNDPALKALDDISELTSLSDLSDIEKDTNRQVHEEEVLTPTSSPDFSASNKEMWETVCVTLAEWEAFPQRFEKSTHRTEKAFYKLLTNDLVPMVTEVLRVDVRKKHMEDAVVHRKRSSRIAVKESVREAERAEAQRKADEEKELERHKRWEARARKEEDERIRRETLRSLRLREKGRGESESMDVDVVGGGAENRPLTANGTAHEAPTMVTTPVKFVINASKSGTQTPKDDEPWELDCEICHRRGMNLDDGQELMCCERCNKWQHIRCHDQANFITGRPRRNWELDDFLCAACAAKGHSVSQGSSLQQPQPHVYPSHTQPWTQPNGVMATVTNGVVTPQPYHQSQPDHRTTMPVKAGSGPQTSSDTASYGNGRTGYFLTQARAQQPHSAPIVAQTHSAQRSQLAANSTTGNAVYPASSPSQSHNPPAAPYTATPNMYLSNYSGNYRPSQNAHNPVVQKQHPQSTSQYSTTRGQPASAATQAAGRPPQQAQWNNVGHGSAAPYARSATGTSQAQHNSYYRSHPAPSNPLASSHHIAPVQPYYTGGPTSQS